MKHNIHNTNWLYFMSNYNLTEENWEFLGKVPIKLSKQSYYSDLRNGVELIEKIYKNYYWEIVSMRFKICFSDKENYSEIMTNETIKKWFKLFSDYEILSNIDYNYTTLWKLMCCMYAKIYLLIQEQRSIKSNEENIKETGKN